MRFIIVIVILLFLSCRDKNNSPVIQIQNGETFECTLVNSELESLKCGVLKVMVGMLFKLEKQNEKIIVLIPCPEQYEEGFFVEGRKYFIELTSDSSKFSGFTIINKYASQNLPTYYSVAIRT